MHDNLSYIALLLIDLAEHAEASGVDIARDHPSASLLFIFN